MSLASRLNKKETFARHFRLDDFKATLKNEYTKIGSV